MSTPPCPSCGERLTLYPTHAKCYACGWMAEPNPYRPDYQRGTWTVGGDA